MVWLIVPVSWFLALSHPLMLSHSNISVHRNMAVGTHWKVALQSAALMLDVAWNICESYGSGLRFPSALHEGFSFCSAVLRRCWCSIIRKQSDQQPLLIFCSTTLSKRGSGSTFSRESQWSLFAYFIFSILSVMRAGEWAAPVAVPLSSCHPVANTWHVLKSIPVMPVCLATQQDIDKFHSQWTNKSYRASPSGTTSL